MINLRKKGFNSSSCHTIHKNTLKLDVLYYDRTSKGTQENEVRANLRANIEVVANRSRYTSTDYFPDDNEFSPDILTSLKSTRSYFSILVGIYSKLVVEACIFAAIYHNPSEQCMYALLLKLLRLF